VTFHRGRKGKNPVGTPRTKVKMQKHAEKKGSKKGSFGGEAAIAARVKKTGKLLTKKRVYTICMLAERGDGNRSS